MVGNWVDLGRFPIRKVRNNVYEIKGDTDKQYFLYTNSSDSILEHCSCPDFAYRGKSCKHLCFWSPMYNTSYNSWWMEYVEGEVPKPIKKEILIF